MPPPFRFMPPRPSGNDTVPNSRLPEAPHFVVAEVERSAFDNAIDRLPEMIFAINPVRVEAQRSTAIEQIA